MNIRLDAALYTLVLLCRLMKNALIVIVILILFVWIISWFRRPAVVAAAASKPWPGGMGTLESVDKRFPPVKANDASVKLVSLAKAFAANKAVDDFVAREIVRGDMSVGEPPSIPDVTAVRELLLRDAVIWKRRGGVGGIGAEETTVLRVTLMNVARALVGSALTKARVHDATSWDDLHAVWNLARSLDGQPLMMLQTATFSIERMINAVAWKMPLPAPAWLADLQRRDDVRHLLEGFQAQVAWDWKSGARVFPTKWLADSVEIDRRAAESLFHETRCDVAPPTNNLGTDLSTLWRRAFRYRAEREATMNALRIRERKAIEQKSQCSDGAWTFDGTTLRFSRDIVTAPPDKPMPLVLRVSAD